jgi:hypothetical protein
MLVPYKSGVACGMNLRYFCKLNFLIVGNNLNS